MDEAGCTAEIQNASHMVAVICFANVHLQLLSEIMYKTLRELTQIRVLTNRRPKILT